MFLHKASTYSVSANCHQVKHTTFILFNQTAKKTQSRDRIFIYNVSLSCRESMNTASRINDTYE